MSAADPQGKRAIAKQNGDKTYFTGVPCKRGHLAPRYTSMGICVTCKQETFARRYVKDREKVLAEGRAWKDANAERMMEYAKKYRQDNIERIRARDRKDGQENRAYYTSMERKRQANKLQATPKWLTQDDWQYIHSVYLTAKKIQEQSGMKMAVDHIVPLQGKTVSGLHVPWNLRVISCSENSRKHAALNDDAYLPKQIGVMVGQSGLPWNWSI